MGKPPAFQFYIKDWLTDPQLRMTSASTKGIWIDIICYMWADGGKGILQTSKENLAKLTGSKMCEVELFFSESEQYGFCDISVTDNGLSQICNRRMFRDEKDRENNRLRQKKYREKKKSNEKVTLHSPSPSPSPTPSPKKNRVVLPDWLDKNLWEEYKKYRSNGKQKFTAYAQSLAIKNLEKLKNDGNDPSDVIKQTIICGWSGLFPLNRNKNNNQEQETPEQWLERQRKRRS